MKCSRILSLLVLACLLIGAIPIALRVTSENAEALTIATGDSNGFESYAVGTTNLGVNWSTTGNVNLLVQSYTAAEGSRGLNITGSSVTQWACKLVFNLTSPQSYGVSKDRAIYTFWIKVPDLLTQRTIHFYRAAPAAAICSFSISQTTGAVLAYKSATGYNTLTGTVVAGTWYGFYAYVNFTSQLWSANFGTTMPTSGQGWMSLRTGNAETGIDQLWFTGEYMNARQIILDDLQIQYQMDGLTPVVFTVDAANPIRAPNDAWEGTVICEQTDFKTDSGFFSWYRGNSGANSQLGYETSADGVTWTPYAGNPIGLMGHAYFYVVPYNSYYYLFAVNLTSNNMFMWNVTNPVSPIAMNGGNPVYWHSTTASAWDYQIFNPGIAIANGVWHMMLEGKTSTSNFQIGYAYSTFAELNWSAHRSSNIILPTAGNPLLTYIPEHDSLLSIFGDISGSKWRLRAVYADVGHDLSYLANWTNVSTSVFNLTVAGIHIADPSICVPFNSTYDMMIAYNYNQATTYQAYYPGSLLELFEQMTGMTEPTVEPEIELPNLSNDLQASFEYTITGFMVKFVETTYGGSSLRIWSFGDGYGSTNPYPEHEYRNSGRYVVTLTAYDGDGHSSIAQGLIEVSLGPMNPIEKTGEGWRVYWDENTTLFLSASGLGVGGAIMVVSTFFIPSIPIVTVRARRLVGIIMIGLALYCVVFVKGIIDFGGFG